MGLHIIVECYRPQYRFSPDLIRSFTRPEPKPVPLPSPCLLPYLILPVQGLSLAVTGNRSSTFLPLSLIGYEPLTVRLRPKHHCRPPAERETSRGDYITWQ